MVIAANIMTEKNDEYGNGERSRLKSRFCKSHESTRKDVCRAVARSRCIAKKAFCHGGVSDVRSRSSHNKVVGDLLIKALFAIVLGVITLSSAFAEDLAFPGATGFGKSATGWRQGRVVRVTSLEDSGPGSLRACAEDSTGPRVCVFAISGTIEVDSTIRVTSNTYIAGQTAPAKGIQIKLANSNNTPLVVINAHDVLIRFLKLRPGRSRRPSSNVDGITIISSERVYLDHLSVQFATDENVTVYTSKRPTYDITIARSIIALGLDRANHPKGRHSKGALICSHEGPSAKPCGRVSLIENLFAHNRDRNPDVKASASWPVEVVNNVFYDPISQFGEFYNLLGDTWINYVGNVALPGPSTRSRPRPAAIQAFEFDKSHELKIFENDNLSYDHCKRLSKGTVVDARAIRFVVEQPPQPLTHRPGPSAGTLEHVLKVAGARFGEDRSVDPLDAAVLNDVRSCHGKVINDAIEVGGWPELPRERGPADRDEDGMPDAWEDARVGLDSSDPRDAWRDRDGDGWSNLEEFLGHLAGDYFQ